MLNKIVDWVRSGPAERWFYPVAALELAAVYAACSLEGVGFIWFWLSAVAVLVFTLRPGSLIYKPACELHVAVRVPVAAVAALIVVLGCTAPMDTKELWNGEKPQWRNQYELMAESILEGRIDLDCCEAKDLAKLENPYDREARKKAGVEYFHYDYEAKEWHAHWDHAYYDGHFYMYFGVAPVFLAFLPYRVITGQPLTTYQGTQFFVALAIIGIFMLFYKLSRVAFKRLPFGVYLAAAGAFSVMSVWYSSAEPALYCTAITAAIAMEVWSIFFFIWAVYGEKRENRQLILAAVGALFGALAFGCRPPIAIANVVVIPMLVTFIKQRKFSLKLLGKLAAAASPYIVIGIALMAYNYVRFDSFFEFGQAYQLTVTDQSNYSVSLDGDSILRLINEGLNSFFDVRAMGKELPYLTAGGVFFNFPMLALCALAFVSPVAKKLKEKGLFGTVVALLGAVALITAMDILWSPYLLERYHMDVYFLLGIACFITVAAWLDCEKERSVRRRACFVSSFAVLTLVSAILLFMRTYGVDNLSLLVK